MALAAPPNMRASLIKANDHRIKRAATRAWIREAGTRRAAIPRACEILADVPEHMATASIHYLLMSIPRIGRYTAHVIAVRLDISDTRTLAELTERQREALIDRLTNIVR